MMVQPRKRPFSVVAQGDVNLGGRLVQVDLDADIQLVGQYAQAYYLGTRRKPTLAATVRAHAEFTDEHL